MKKFTFLLAGLLILFAGLSRAYADTTIVSDDFESYADNTALLAAWPSSTGTDNATMLTTDNTYYPNIDGQAAEFNGAIGYGASSVNKWAGSFSIVPSASQYIELSADIGDDASSSNKKNSLGLRNSSGANILEMGVYNGTAGMYYAYRIINFSGTNPNWAYFNLPTDFNTPDEVGAGFHHYTATIEPDEIILTLDLFNDGIISDPNSPDYGMPGVDATNIIPITTTAAGFNDLRFGIPSASGSSTGQFNAYDNISLKLIDVVGGGLNGDFNNDDKVDAADYVVWRKNDAANNSLPNDNNATDQATRYTLWRSNFGSSTPGSGSSLSNVAAVAEPATVVLLVLGLVAVPVRGRRK